MRHLISNMLLAAAFGLLSACASNPSVATANNFELTVEVQRLKASVIRLERALEDEKISNQRLQHDLDDATETLKRLIIIDGPGGPVLRIQKK